MDTLDNDQRLPHRWQAALTAVVELPAVAVWRRHTPAWQLLQLWRAACVRGVAGLNSSTSMLCGARGVGCRGAVLRQCCCSGQPLCGACMCRCEPNEPCSLSALRELGVLAWKLDADNHETDPRLAAIRKVRGYSYTVRTWQAHSRQQWRTVGHISWQQPGGQQQRGTGRRVCCLEGPAAANLEGTSGAACTVLSDAPAVSGSHSSSSDDLRRAGMLRVQTPNPGRAAPLTPCQGGCCTLAYADASQQVAKCRRLHTRRTVLTAPLPGCLHGCPAGGDRDRQGQAAWL